MHGRAKYTGHRLGIGPLALSRLGSRAQSRIETLQNSLWLEPDVRNWG